MLRKQRARAAAIVRKFYKFYEEEANLIPHGFGAERDAGDESSGTPGRIRTHDLLIRSQSLYPAELRARWYHSTVGMPVDKPQSEPSPMEVEIKLRVDDLSATLGKIRSLGFTESEARSFERNVVYDTTEHTLMHAKQLLRVREYRGETILTYKGSPVPGKHKQREELELTLSSSERFGEILNRLGYAPIFRYEKFRTVFERPNTGCHIAVDETPIGPFLELEGEADAIDAVAAELGFAPEDYITASYATLSRDHFAAQGLAPGDFVFPKA